MKVDYHAVLVPGRIYHFYNKAVSNRKLFYDVSDYERFLSNFQMYFNPYLEIISYCLIPNHYHYMVRIKEIDETLKKHLNIERTTASQNFLIDEISFDEFLSDQFRRLLSSHSLFINKKYKMEGPLLLKKGKRTEVKNEVKFYDLLCYIHHNPIHHGLSKNYNDWPYTSYMEYLSELDYVNSYWLLRDLGNDDIEIGRREFIKLHEAFLQDYKEGFASL